MYNWAAAQEFNRWISGENETEDTHITTKKTNKQLNMLKEAQEENIEALPMSIHIRQEWKVFDKIK